jgi:branched-chain amino acid transport system substrate-binding protein
MELKSRTVRRAKLALVVILLMTGMSCLVAGEEPYVSEWNLPALTMMSGAWAALGLEGKWAMDLAVQEINASGGIRGIPISLAWYDTAYDPAKTIQQMGRAVDQEPLLILGPQYDTPLSAAVPIACREQVFVLAADGTVVPFLDCDWGTSLGLSYKDITTAAAEYWYSLHGNNVSSVVLFTNLASTTIAIQAAEWRRVLEEKGIKVYPDIEVPSDTVNYGPSALKAVNYGAEAFIHITGPVQAAKLDIELYNLGVTEGWRIVNYLATNSSPLYEFGEGYLEGTYTYDNYNPYYDGDAWRSLLAKYQAWKPGAQPSFSVPYDYDLPYIVKQCFEDLEITGDPAKLEEEREKIREYLLHLDFDGVQGHISVVAGTGGAQRPLWWFVIQDNTLHEMAELEVTMTVKEGND